MLNFFFTFFSGEEFIYELLPGNVIPQPYRKLLVHSNHMTPTLEKFYGQPLNVEVIKKEMDDSRYQRCSFLWLPDIGVVEIGIVQMDISLFSLEVRREILQGEKPLGKILIDHNEPRNIQVETYFKLQTTPSLEEAFRASATCFYGRSTTISCQKAPIKVVEIIRPQGVKSEGP